MNSMISTLCFLTLLFSVAISAGPVTAAGYYSGYYGNNYPYRYGGYNNFLNGGLYPGVASPLTAAGTVAAYNYGGYGGLGYGYNYGYGYPLTSGYYSGYPYVKK